MATRIKIIPPVTVSVASAPADLERLARWQAESFAGCPLPLSRDPRWLSVFQEALRHEPYCLQAESAGRTVGLLPLALVRSLLFGRFLVSIPYLNTGGVAADDEPAAAVLIDQAVSLADRLDVRYLELRHEQPHPHPALGHELTSKVHMRLPLPDRAELLWQRLGPKVRNQVRKGEKAGLGVRFGGAELLDDFYGVFSRNMRDLGTPVFGRLLFECILNQFPGRAELCAVRLREKPVAAALLIHGQGVTEVPSASSLRRYNPTNANMLMYWRLLERAIEHRQQLFDFGRSSTGSSTHRFKKQWGAAPEAAVWQYHVRKGSIESMRPDSPRNRPLVRIWKHLPVSLTRVIGPAIVRGIP